MERSPILIESGTKFFLEKTLKNCNKTRFEYYSFILNLTSFFIFIVVLGGILVYKKKTKLSKIEKKKKHEEEKKYFLTKLRGLNEEAQRKQNLLITNLPKYENDFEKMHKFYYQI